MKKIYIYSIALILVLLGWFAFFTKKWTSVTSIILKPFSEKAAKAEWPLNLDDATVSIYKAQKWKDDESGSIASDQRDFLKKLWESGDVTSSVDGWVSYDQYKKLISEYSWTKNEYSIEIDAVDYETNSFIGSGSLYVNGVKIWNLDKWKYIWDFEWPKWAELFNFMIRTSWYWDWFLTMNALNSNWNLLLWTIKMKKSESRTVNLDKDQRISFKDFSIYVPHCSLVSESQECFSGEASIEAVFVTWDEANSRKISLWNMRAIIWDWKIGWLISGWMAFIEFKDKDWNYLKVWNGKTVTVSYKVSEDDITRMKSVIGKMNWSDDWYWFFDKRTSLWEKRDAKITLNEKELTWSAEVGEIY
ncbi:MAG: hypothetical protein ACD_2C00182G0015 [uncultured bacterium (gcode 4)]|uniref:Uncharacterized protein n=1 Tax=uncultured bacterium (gcode 4) TaxID=1234023 RepID=K2H0P9_9BACT|nr:MAG: hypothetical protein ACD_2C00182G0015 [uncultured bacterium (gcode 4)]